MRRRLALGLADPITTHRFALWGIAAGSAGTGTVVGLSAVALQGFEMVMAPSILASSSAFGTVSALAMWIAFFPPRAYRMRYERAAG